LSSVYRPRQHSIGETVLQVRSPNQQYQSTEGKDTTKVKKNQKTKQHKIQQNNIHTHSIP